MRWVANLTLTVVQADVERGPQGNPVTKPQQKFDFNTVAECSGDAPLLALDTVVKRFTGWTELLTSGALGADKS